ncbi:leucyl aminopeptidase family protein [Paenibacillus sp. N3/727]|uniref:leucyl aminopeptidase family protein n=1 Tax=Paenibacillus sp. N3/727 TaxID=2925845 RepID=UPI001F536658|nr:leucyl aminopeptidase family protein [Paenibacillus sp. N3/727]UNK17353.1 leucyl aminopeptidase family protein [Paenibacillus sp. N3/727]
MHIKLIADRKTDVQIYPLYQKEEFIYPIRDAYREAGHTVWFLSRSEEDRDILVVGLGERNRLDLETVRRAGGLSARKIQKEGLVSACLVRKADPGCCSFSSVTSSEWIQAWLEGWLLGLYGFHKYRTLFPLPVEVTLQIHPGDWPEMTENELQQVIRTAKIRAAGTVFARDLVNETPDYLHPDRMVEWIKARFKDIPVKVTVYSGEQLAERQMNGLLKVGAGSVYPPAMIELRYEGDASLPLISLVGKGITFDMGGMNVKSGKDLSDARMDMGGAAAVAGAMDILASQRAKVNVVALIAVAENVPDAHAMLPSSIVTFPNGITVQAANTDAEGRLVLADALLHAAALGAVEAIDIATLTGNVGAALGLGIAGIWGDEAMTQRLVSIGDRNGERLWPMPLMDEYESELHSDYADLSNIGSSSLAGAITAALFIRRFVTKPMKWVHIDMAGTVQYKGDAGYSASGATGYGARLLADYVLSRHCTGTLDENGKEVLL